MSDGLYYAANGDLAALKVWLDEGSDRQKRLNTRCSEQSESLLHKAAFKGYTEIVRFLLDQGLDVNVLDKSGFSPLHEAARNNQPQCIELLLLHNANPTAKTGKGATPLDMAVEKKAAPEAIEMLKFGLAGWFKASDDLLVHVQGKGNGPYRITEMFNFSTRVYSAIATSIVRGTESLSMRTFEELAGSNIIHTAQQKMLELGGRVPDGTVSVDKPRFRLPRR